MIFADWKWLAKFYLISPIGRILYLLSLRRNEFDSARCAAYMGQRKKVVEKAFGANIDDAPVMDKDSYRASPKSFQRPVRFGSQISTSGTTGAPATFSQSVSAVVLEEAHVQRQLSWAGIGVFDRRVWIRGDVVRPRKSRPQGLWRNLIVCRTLIMSSYHLSNETAQKYLRRIESYQPTYIQAYPSSIVFLARVAKESGANFNFSSVRSVITSSEELSRENREVIESAFGCKVFDWYGQAERVAAIGTCPLGKLHLIDDYGFYEIGAPGEEPVELVATGLNNTATRLWRYRTGDSIAVSDVDCSCGRAFRTVDTIVGRSDRAVTLADGRVIGRLDHIFKGIEGVREGQIVHISKDQFQVRVVPNAQFSDVQRHDIKRNFLERVAGVDVEVVLVPSIPRGRTGKFEFVKVLV